MANNAKTKIDSCSKYWHEFLLPDLADFATDQGNMRKAFHSAISLFHMADWIYKEKTLPYWRSVNLQFRDRNSAMATVHDDKSFANAIATINSDFELVRGVANAAKHFELRHRGNHPAAPISSANTYSRISGFDSSAFDQTSFDATDEVMLEGPNGNDLLFLALANSSKDTLEKFCNEHNISLIKTEPS